MKKILFVCATMVLLATATTSFAAEGTVSAKEPDKILSIAKGFGSAELGVDRDGDPRIKGRIEGTNYYLYFFGCKENKNCTSVQFYTVWSRDDKPSLEDINTWNSKIRFGKAYLDSEKDPALKMDVVLLDVTPAYLEEWFDWWRVIVANFKKHIEKK